MAFQLKKTILAPVAVLAAVLVLELFLRLAGYASPPKEFLFDGSYAASRADAPRNNYIDAVFSDATFNIVVFGEFWGYGLGVTRDQTFPALLEKKLQDERHLAVRVVNVSQPAFSSREIKGIFQRMLARYKADLAVVMTGMADCVPNDLKENYFGPKPYSIGARKTSDRIRVLRLASNIALASRLNGRDIDPEGPKDFVERYRTIEQTQSSLLEIGKAAKEAGVRLIYVTFPQLPEPGWFSPHYPLYSRRNLLIRSAADNFEDPVLDLEKLMPPDKVAGYLLPWMRWPNLNPTGHRFVAGELLKMIEPMLSAVPQT